MRENWIKAVSKHQEFDFYSKYFTICEKNFTTDDFSKKNGMKKLRPNALFMYPLLSESDCGRLLLPEIRSNERKLICKIQNCNKWKTAGNENVTLFFR